jgi:hypothetical protein
MTPISDINTLISSGQACGKKLGVLLVFPTKFPVVPSWLDRDNSRFFLAFSNLIGKA